eukprot:TRINITY_DN17226_c0_g1_i1.p1 TRINITY_DN17226_c0_g1~~TRINITY_DN17226_c0_g1_i1.p1  ORF type:complete len:316 (+),score=2.28 TRINITY_DN17226_c0_g1_i1:476-1423(+)
MCVVVPICGFGEWPQRDTFKESLKALEADVQHANTLMAGDMLRDYDGAYLQMRLGFSPLAPLLLFLVRWTDCSLAGALGLLRVLVFKVHKNGRSTAASHERKASLSEFYGFLFPSLLQLQPALPEPNKPKQKKGGCDDYFRRRRDSTGATRSLGSSSYSVSSCSSSSSTSSTSSFSDIDDDEACDLMTSVDHRDDDLASMAACMAADREREHECGICLEEIRFDGSDRVALPGCAHSMCTRCFRDWSARSDSCPFCRDELGKVKEEDLWVVVEETAAEDIRKVMRDSLRRFFLFVHRLPVVISDGLLPPHDYIPL